MLKQYLFALLLVTFFSAKSKATTWDEPWQDKVIKDATHFIFAKILSKDESKGLSVEIIRSFSGDLSKKKISINGFYDLKLCSSSGDEGPEFHFEDIDSCYFFLKQINDSVFYIATPTSGFAPLLDGKVIATYRHSYHQASVSPGIYEHTMTAIFNNYHGKQYDAKYINDFIQNSLSKKPAGFSNAEVDIFFEQHVALETIYHLKLAGYYKLVLPFLQDATNFHNQVSAARAMISSNSAETKNELLAFIKTNDKNHSDFAKVICIWTLKTLDPKDLKNELKELAANASTNGNGFGGNIMDPRVCTSLPSVKDALADLLNNL